VERVSRVLQFALNIKCDWVRAAEHAPRGPFRLLERIHGLAEITVCGCGVFVEQPRVVAANVADAAFYELAREAFMGRRLACHGNSS